MSENNEGTFWVDEQTKELVLKEDNEEQRFYIDEEVEVENNQYLVLIPSEDQKTYNEEEALVLKVAEEDGEEILSVIESDSEFEKVKNAYMNI